MNVEAPNVVQDPLRHLYVRALIRTANQIAGNGISHVFASAQNSAWHTPKPRRSGSPRCIRHCEEHQRRGNRDDGSCWVRGSETAPCHDAAEGQSLVQAALELAAQFTQRPVLAGGFNLVKTAAISTQAVQGQEPDST
jgi:hypothetical protein